MKMKVVFFVSVLLLIASFTAPVLSFPPGGSGEWPCTLTQVMRNGQLEWDCVGNGGPCLCTIFVY